MILFNLFSKPKKTIERPLDYAKSLKKINTNVTFFLGCTIEILPNGKYKAFDKICNTHFEACQAVIEWKAKHENSKIKLF